jgi:hypothetical protein
METFTSGVVLTKQPLFFCRMSSGVSLAVSSSQLLPYDCYFEYLSKHDPEMRQFLFYLREEILLQRTTRQQQELPSFIDLQEDSTKQTQITDLPLECMLQIFSYLDPKSLCRSQCVCREWRDPASLDWLWKDLCFFSFQSSPEEFKFNKSVTLKEVYSSMHLVMYRTFHPPKPQSFRNFAIPAFLLTQF